MRHACQDEGGCKGGDLADGGEGNRSGWPWRVREASIKRTWLRTYFQGVVFTSVCEWREIGRWQQATNEQQLKDCPDTGIRREGRT